MNGWLKVAAGAVPLFLAGLTAVGWSNSHSMALLTQEYRDIQAELQHQREVVEQRLAGCK
jgi:cell division protein FtsX